MKKFTPKKLNFFKLLYLVSIVLVSLNTIAKNLTGNDIVFKITDDREVTSINTLPYKFVAKQNRTNNLFSESDSRGHRDFSDFLKIKANGLSFHYYRYC